MANPSDVRRAPVESVINSETFTTKDRLRVSNTSTNFFSSFQFGKGGQWDESTSNGGTATYDSTLGGINLSATSTTNSEVIFQTRRTMHYIPGRASGLSGAFRLSNVTANMRYRWGLFDENNGAFFEINGSNIYCVVRSNTSGSVVETKVSRDQWNEDKLDGTGRSGIVLDLTKQHLLLIQYEWYGAGEVKFYFIIDGRKRLVHVISHANRISTVWARTPFLPIRAEVKNLTGVNGGGTMYFGSVSMYLEGGGGYEGQIVNLSTPITGFTTTSSNTFYPIISGRLKSTSLNAVVVPLNFQIATVDNTSLHYKVLINGTLTGGTWVDTPNTDPITQYNVTSTAITGGTEIFGGFQAAPGTAPVITFDFDSQLGRSSLGTVSDVFTICAATTNGNKVVVASVNWLEQR